MINTENLQLPILEDSDSFSLVFTQGNTISEKVEEFGTTQKLKNDNFQLEINEINDNINNFEQRTNEKISVLENNIKHIEVGINGVFKKGRVYAVKIEVEPTVNSNVLYAQEYGVDNKNETRIAIGTQNIMTRINITDLFGYSADKIDILNVCAYAKGYYNYQGKTNPIPLSPRTLAVITPSGDTNLQLELTGNTTYVTKQTYQSVSGVGIWNPSATVVPQEGKVTVMLQAVVYK